MFNVYLLACEQALYVLSRALEANPTVATLWIVYIGLFYHGKGEIGDDDLFFHAVFVHFLLIKEVSFNCILVIMWLKQSISHGCSGLYLSF